jgi:hypothetical protein
MAIGLTAFWTPPCHGLQLEAEGSFAGSSDRKGSSPRRYAVFKLAAALTRSSKIPADQTTICQPSRNSLSIVDSRHAIP